MPHGNESAVSERSEFGCVYGVKYGLFGTAAFPGSPDEITKSRGDDEIEIGTHSPTPGGGTSTNSLRPSGLREACWVWVQGVCCEMLAVSSQRACMSRIYGWSDPRPLEGLADCRITPGVSMQHAGTTSDWLRQSAETPRPRMLKPRLFDLTANGTTAPDEDSGAMVGAIACELERQTRFADPRFAP
jgi:hypothetical protein